MRGGQRYYQVGTRVYHRQTDCHKTDHPLKKICRTASARTTEEFFTKETIDSITRWITERVKLIDSILDRVQDYCVAVTVIMNDEKTAVVYMPTMWLVCGILFMRPPDVPFALYVFQAGRWIELEPEDLKNLQQLMNGTSIDAPDIIKIIAHSRSIANSMMLECIDPKVHKIVDHCE